MFKRVPLHVVVLIGLMLIFGLILMLVLFPPNCLPYALLCLVGNFVVLTVFIFVLAATIFGTYQIVEDLWTYLRSFFRASALSLMLAGGISAVFAFSMGILYGVLTNM